MVMPEDKKYKNTSMRKSKIDASTKGNAKLNTAIKVAESWKEKGESPSSAYKKGIKASGYKEDPNRINKSIAIQKRMQAIKKKK